MVLSHDANCWNDRMGEDVRVVERPDWHFHHILDVVLPGLRDEGVLESDITAMLVTNPARILEPGVPY
jgi:phosphotriesterase-related protein